MVSAIPAISISIEKPNASTFANNISYVTYKVTVNNSIYKLRFNNHSSVSGAPAINYNQTFVLNAYVHDGQISIVDKNHGISGPALKDIIFVYSREYPVDPLNSNLTKSSSSLAYFDSPYSKLYGFFNSVALEFSTSVPYNVNSSYVSGIIGGTIYTGSLNGGRLVYSTRVVGNFYGTVNYLKNTIPTLNPDTLALLGGSNSLLATLSKLNGSSEYEMVATTTYKLISSNVGFVPNLRVYVGYGLLTSSIIPVLWLSYQLGVRRKWKPQQKLLLPIIFMLIYSFLVFPYTYSLYLW